MTVNRRKRGPQKRTIEKAQAGLLDFLKAAGMEVSEEDVRAAYEVAYTPKNHPDTAMLQAEGMLLHIRQASKHFMAKKCLECEEAFSTTYIGVAYCSDLCRGKAIEKQMGIRWDYSKDHYENLSAERPLIVGPQAYQALLAFAHRVIEQHGLVVQETPVSPTPDESDQVPHPNLSAPDTTPEPSLPQLASASHVGLFGPAPF
jgi:hypothetical protein